jgi:hypothetical protein
VRAPPRGVGHHDGEGMRAVLSIKWRGHSRDRIRESAARGTRDDLAEHVKKWVSAHGKGTESGRARGRARESSSLSGLRAGKVRDDQERRRAAGARRVGRCGGEAQKETNDEREEREARDGRLNASLPSRPTSPRLAVFARARLRPARIDAAGEQYMPPAKTVRSIARHALAELERGESRIPRFFYEARADTTSQPAPAFSRTARVAYA